MVEVRPAGLVVVHVFVLALKALVHVLPLMFVVSVSVARLPLARVTARATV